MKNANRTKIYADQHLFRDIGFLTIATGFVLMQGFDMPLNSVALYAPIGVLGGFAALLAFGYVLSTCLGILEKLEIRMGMRRGAKS